MTAPQPYGVLGALEVPLALGLLRLSTEGRPPEADAIGVIHFALEQGIRVLDTADSYALDDKDLHYGEQLVRKALASWSGPKDQVRVITKAGLARPKGKWVPNGRPDHLRNYVEGLAHGAPIPIRVDRDKIPGIQVPTLLIHGKDDRVLHYEVTLWLLANIPNSRAVLLNHCGHWAMIEHAEEFNRLVVDFLSHS